MPNMVDILNERIELLGGEVVAAKKILDLIDPELALVLRKADAEAEGFKEPDNDLIDFFHASLTEQLPEGNQVGAEDRIVVDNEAECELNYKGCIIKGLLDKLGAIKGGNRGVIDVPIALGRALVFDVDVKVLDIHKGDVVGEALGCRKERLMQQVDLGGVPEGVFKEVVGEIEDRLGCLAEFSGCRRRGERKVDKGDGDVFDDGNAGGGNVNQRVFFL
uniref:Uncharacterized protein n=1 Tax=Odontella aurita TaxID=265563 RepID=A0A7S4JTX2_9STRA|mmetsp:Transcript_53864/g.161158  ORF Transcript_53864/g.161158 Transcript_53864/m.161158 type:complete len:219 (+) Transcript_53864:2886-3542(+)